MFAMKKPNGDVVADNIENFNIIQKYQVLFLSHLNKFSNVVELSCPINTNEQ